MYMKTLLVVGLLLIANRKFYQNYILYTVFEQKFFISLEKFWRFSIKNLID